MDHNAIVALMAGFGALLSTVVAAWSAFQQSQIAISKARHEASCQERSETKQQLIATQKDVVLLLTAGKNGTEAPPEGGV
jgi:hypothetical protein